jgi:hypothetical protein
LAHSDGVRNDSPNEECLVCRCDTTSNISREGLSRKAREEAESHGAMGVTKEENKQLCHIITNLYLLDHDDPNYAEFVGDGEEDGDDENVEEQEEDSNNEM